MENKKAVIEKTEKSLRELLEESNHRRGFNEYGQFIEQLFIEFMHELPIKTLKEIQRRSEGNKMLNKKKETNHD